MEKVVPMPTSVTQQIPTALTIQERCCDLAVDLGAMIATELRNDARPATKPAVRRKPARS